MGHFGESLRSSSCKFGRSCGGRGGAHSVDGDVDGLGAGARREDREGAVALLQ